MSGPARVSDAMTGTPRFVEVDGRASRAQQLLKTGDIGHLPVLEGLRLVGVLSRVDLARVSLRAWVRDGTNDGVRLDSLYTVRDLMSPDPVTVYDDDLLSRAASLLSDGSFHCLPVLDRQGALVGMLTTTDLARWLAGPPTPAPDPDAVGAWMTVDPETFHPQTLVRDVPAERRFRHLPIVSGGQLRGVLHRGQLRGVAADTCLGELPAQRAVLVAADLPLVRAISRLRASSEDSLWVIEDGDVKGVFTEHDACRVGAKQLGGRGLCVDALATPMPETIDTNASFETAASRLLRLWVRHLPVLAEGELVGMLSWRDLAGHPEPVPVGAVASSVVQTVRWDTPLEIAASQMVDGHLGALPVVDEEGSLEGILTRVDVMRALVEPLE